MGAQVTESMTLREALGEQSGPERAESESVPDMPTLLGLRSPLVVVAIIALVISCFIAIVGTSGPAPASTWIVQILALLLQVGCMFTVVAIPADPLPRWAAAVIALASLGALGLAWWFAPDDAHWWVQVTAAPAMTAVVAGVFALRGRWGIAWLTVLGAMLVAGSWALSHGLSASLAFPMTTRILATVLPAVVVAVMIRPLLQLIGALRERELAAVRYDAAAEAMADERNERLQTFAGEMRPVLQRLAAGDEFTEQEAQAIRLHEHALRDEVRGRGWDSEGVRVSAFAARARGVVVQLLDDGGLDVATLTVPDAERLRGELIRVLEVSDSGTVTARILPPGRDEAAVITVIRGEDVEHRSYVAAAHGYRWCFTETDAQ